MVTLVSFVTDKAAGDVQEGLLDAPLLFKY